MRTLVCRTFTYDYLLSINVDETSQLENSIQGGGRLQVPQQAAGHRQPQQHFRQFLQQFRDYQVADRKC